MSNLFIKGKNIKTKKNITENLPITISDLSGDIEKLYILFKINKKISLILVIEILNYYFKLDQNNRMKFLKFVQNSGENFSFDRYCAYNEFRKTNRSDVNSDNYFKLVYGDEWEKQKEDFLKKRKNPWDPNVLALKNNIPLDKAIDIINKKKKSKATSLESFITRHGEEKGKILFEKFQNTSKHTEEKYILKYGEDLGSKKWKEYINKKAARSVFKKDYWINKGFSNEEAEILRKEFHRKNLATSSVEFWISKGLSEQDALLRVKNIFIKKKIKFANASKASLKYFLPLKKYFDKLSYNCMFGYECLNEFSIYDKSNKKLNFYDFFVKELNLIIEYHGDKWHPNPEKLSKNDWDNWKTSYYTKNGSKIEVNVEDAYKKDIYKKNLAEKNGYKYIVLWHSDCKEKNWNKINECLISFGLNKISKKDTYENKINK